MSGLAKVGQVEALFAEDDAEAVRLACAKNMPVDCEVWDRDRLVVEIPAKPFEDALEKHHRLVIAVSA